jgi:ATP-dependent protease ClpP protease subunit
MSLSRAPIGAIERPGAYKWELPESALAKWEAAPLAAEADDPNTITIFDVIGEDFWSGGGFTAKRAAAALRSIGPNPVTVNINSPGGDMFEGLAIYNLLAQHQAEVTVNVMGYAASAASIIAMAGDNVLMSPGSMLMIHRAWGFVIGNAQAFADAQQVFTKFDESMADIYVDHTGLAKDDVIAMLDGPSKASDGTWLTVDEAIEKGFADGRVEAAIAAKAQAELPTQVAAKRQVDRALAAMRLPRKARTKLIKELSGASDTTGAAMRDAGEIKENDIAAIRAALVSNTQILTKKG